MEREEELVLLYRQYERGQEALKDLYLQMDLVLKHFQELMKPGPEHGIIFGNKAVYLKDNFSDTNNAFRTICIKRYEIKVEDADKFLKKHTKIISP